LSSEELRRLVKGYALKNAVKYGGRASLGSVTSMILGDHPELKPRAREVASIAREVVEWVNSLSREEQERILLDEYPELLEEKPKTREALQELPPLPQAREGAVVTRFAPNPDFVIHIGNARPAILSYEYARMYKGKMILRFEDTDPRTKSPLRDAYELIRRDLRWLGIHWDEEYTQSLRMEIFYRYAREMLERGCAYVDVCGGESRELLKSGRACWSRDKEPEWQLERWDRMLSGDYAEGEAVVRVKTDLNHPNPSVRDWVALRIIDTEKHPHPLVGSRYRVWPTYNYAVSIDDHLMGVTHVLRGKEHQVNTEKQLYVYKCFDWDTPVFIHFGRLKLEGFIMSKSKIRQLLEENPGEFLGYDDPRFGTIAGLRRRGILAEAIRKVILDVGVKPGDATLSWSNLAAANRKILDPIADRIMYVEDPVWLKLDLEGGGCLTAVIPYHPDKPGRTRSIKVCSGEYVGLSKQDAELGRARLVGLGNFRVEGERLVLEGTGLEEARRERLPIIQWVPRKGAVPVTVLEPVELELVEHRGYAEPALRDYGVDSHLQFIRFGFVRIDQATSEGVVAVYAHS